MYRYRYPVLYCTGTVHNNSRGTVPAVLYCTGTVHHNSRGMISVLYRTVQLSGPCDDGNADFLCVALTNGSGTVVGIKLPKTVFKKTNDGLITVGKFSTDIE